MAGVELSGVDHKESEQCASAYREYSLHGYLQSRMRSRSFESRRASASVGPLRIIT